MSSRRKNLKNGRPHKEAPKEVVTESDKKLEMVARNEQSATMQDVRNSLNELFAKAIGDNVSRNFLLGDDANLNFQKYNPFLQNQRLKNVLNTTPGQMSRDDLVEALKAPQNKEQPLRSQGWSLSSSQHIYYQILRFAADIPKFKYYKTPELLSDTKKYRSKEFTEEDKYVDDWLKALDVVNTFKRMSLEIKREGKPTYVLRNCVSTREGGHKKVEYATFQKLPSNYIKLIGIGEHGFIASFNMLVFLNPAIVPEQYPEFIREIWADMIQKGVVLNSKPSKDFSNIDFNVLKNYSFERSNIYGSEKIFGTLEIASEATKKSYCFWVPLPQDLCYTFCSDNSNPWAIPDTSGLFLGLQELADYDQLAGLLQSTPLTALLTAEMETVNNPNPGQDQTVMNPETIAGFQDKFNSSASSNIEAFFAPLKDFKLLSLPDVPNASETSTNATKNFVYRAGLGGLIITTEKPSVTQIKTAQLLKEAECDYVTKQFESVVNMIINDLLGCKFQWNFHLWGNIFTFADELKRDKELWQAGATFLLPKIASAYDLSLRETRSIEHYVQSLEIYDDLKTVTQEAQAKNIENQNNNSDGSVGRPKKNEDEIDNDNTAASIDGGLDEASTRDYIAEKTHACKCIVCGEDTDGDALCEECEAEYLED